MYHDNIGKKKKCSPQKRTALYLVKPIVAAGFKSPWGQAAAKLFSDSWLFRLFLNLTKSF